ncbi:hypothetical protein EYF80_048488 [Liparis tanakae]|uniref:Uncharacterized protein n=1 Tax=Liparis tanakae TaxID=230148 RepID=A0A4Z2FJL6_9TELE|nr:hypothetical protein EYF80_048488 [Liparis tanakae]
MNPTCNTFAHSFLSEEKSRCQSKARAEWKCAALPSPEKTSTPYPDLIDPFRTRVGMCMKFIFLCIHGALSKQAREGGGEAYGIRSDTNLLHERVGFVLGPGGRGRGVEGASEPQEAERRGQAAPPRPVVQQRRFLKVSQSRLEPPGLLLQRRQLGVDLAARLQQRTGKRTWPASTRRARATRSRGVLMRVRRLCCRRGRQQLHCWAHTACAPWWSPSLTALCRHRSSWPTSFSRACGDNELSSRASLPKRRESSAWI